MFKQNSDNQNQDQEDQCSLLGVFFLSLQGLQKQLQRAEPLLSKNGVNYQCAVFSHLQQTTYGFVSVGTHYCELK